MTTHRPTLAEFCELAGGHCVVPVYRRLVGDTLTPVTAFCKLREGDWSFLFESVVGGERLGRYSFLGSNPFLTFTARDATATIVRNGNVETRPSADPLKLLEETLAPFSAPHVPGLPRFCGGAVGFAGYDVVRYSERLPHPPADDRGLPDLAFAFYDRMAIFDHFDKTIAIVAHAHIDPANLEGCYRAACDAVDAMVEKLHRGVADLQLTDIDAAGTVGERPSITSNFAPGAYESAVSRCQEYIKAGDAFQVVLSQRWKTETRARPFDVYRALRVVNPSPFMFYLQSGGATLVGASPEILARVEQGTVTVRPLAGTRPRGTTPADDVRLGQELQADPKERAEHVMLVDLGRNDIGRVAELGTVALADLMAVERYSHVMHLSSTVTGRLKKGLTSFDALRACLPAGTLSGAPKVRAMQIIDELEPHRRGPYGGAVGYIDFAGDMDTCIVLRTLVMQGQTAYLQAGAGIVADSDPPAERQETENKAKGLLKAIEVAERQL